MIGAAVGAARSALRVDRSKLSAGAAVRASVGIAIPLAAGAATGQLLIGVTIAIGALAGGIASLQGTYRSRARLVVVASAGMGLSAFVGTTLGHIVGLDIVVIAVWGFAAGLLVIFGQAPTVVGLQAVVGVVVFSQFTFSISGAARQGALVVAGGIVQAILVTAVWPLRRFPAERAALGNAYRRLSDYARLLTTTPTSLMPPGSMDDLGTALRDPQPFGGRVEMAAYQALLDQVERVRLDLAGLARGRQRLSATDSHGAVQEMDAVAQISAGVLGEVADAVRTARAARPALEEWGALDAAIDRLRTAAGCGGNPAGGGPHGGGPGGRWQQGVLRQARDTCEALAGQLRAVVRLVGVPAGEEPDFRQQLATDNRAITSSRTRRWHSTRSLPLREAIRTVQANLTLGSEGCRHAIRLAVALAIAKSISHLFPLGHGYWLPLTVVIVLKPDFAATFSRGVARCAGTLVGAGLVTVIVATLRPPPFGLVLLAVALYMAAVTFLLANYAIFSVCVAALVVTLLGFTGQPELPLAADRSFYTVIGGALALLAYAAWPTWTRTVVPDRLAALVEADGHYANAVLVAWANPAEADPVALHRSRLDARLARSNAEASVDRWLAEPARHDLDPEVARGVLAAVRPYVQAALTLHVHLPPAGPVRPAVAVLANQVDKAMGTVAAALRSGSPDQPLPQLRAAQLDLVTQLGVDPIATLDQGSPDNDTVVLVSETDLMVNAIDTLGHLVRLDPKPEAVPPGSLRSGP